MAGLFSWVTDTAASIKTYVTNTIYGAYARVAAAIYTAYSATHDGVGFVAKKALTYSTSDTTTQTILEAWQGFSLSLNPEILTTALRKQHKNIRTILTRAAITNLVVYAGSSVAYEWGVKPAFKQIPEFEDTRAEWVLDWAAYLFFLRLGLNTMVSNAIYYATLPVALQKEVVLPKRRNGKVEGCTHVQKDPSELARADLMSVPYYYGNQAVVAVVNNVPVVGPLLAQPFSAFVYGRSLLEYKLAADGLCVADRHDILARNNAYAFGFGCSFVAGAAFWNAMLYHYTGVSSPYAAAGIAHVAFMHHIVAAYLIDKPLPGKVVAADPKRVPLDMTSWLRDGVDGLLSRLVKSLAPLLSGEQGEFLQQFKSYLETKPVRLARRIVLPRSFQSLPAFFARTDARLYEEMQLRKMQNVLKEVRRIRRSPEVRFYKYFNWALPASAIPPETRQLLDKVILHPDLKWLLSEVEKHLKRVEYYSQATGGANNALEGLHRTGRYNFASGRGRVPVRLRKPALSSSSSTTTARSGGLGPRSSRVLDLRAGRSSGSLLAVSEQSMFAVDTRPSPDQSGQVRRRPVSTRTLYGGDSD